MKLMLYSLSLEIESVGQFNSHFHNLSVTYYTQIKLNLKPIEPSQSQTYDFYDVHLVT